MMSTKHELWCGEVIAMADASFVHVQIVGNLIGALVNATVDGPCVVLPPSMLVYVPVRVSVVCGEPEFVGDRTDVIANPTVIVEVLSDATELFDRGEKFRGYRAVPSVIDYVLVVHDRVRVEHYTRGATALGCCAIMDPVRGCA